MDERRKPLPYLRWYVADYRASRRVQRLTWQERGIYRELLDECWIEGSIPDDPPRLAEIAGVPQGVMAEAWVHLRPMFVEIDGLDGMYLTHRRLETERSEDDAYRVRMANAGRKGGLAKASKAKQGYSKAKPAVIAVIAEQSSSAASASSAQPLEGAASDADRLATPEEIRAILDTLRRPNA
jgi:uncharacterized protein YdaU (DUF1376 family)